MIHIVFNEADVKILQEVIELDETLAGEVIQIKDDFSVGPLNNIYIGDGIENRKQWWRDILLYTEYDGRVDDGSVDDNKTAATLVGTMRRNDDENIWIWAAQNAHDVCGYYWLLHYLKEFQGRVKILYLNNLPFINDKGNIFYPDYLAQIPVKEFLKAKKLAREISLSEFEVEPDEWLKICNEEKGVRILEGGKKLAQCDYNYFDADIKKFVTNEFQKASKILLQVGTKTKINASDVYLLWRLKAMAAMNIFEVQGEMKQAKDFELKLV